MRGSRAKKVSENSGRRPGGNGRQAVLADDKNLVDLVGEILEDKPTLRHGSISSGDGHIMRQLYRRWQHCRPRRVPYAAIPGCASATMQNENRTIHRRRGNHDATQDVAQRGSSASRIAVRAVHISVLRN